MRGGAVLLEPLDAPADLSPSTKSCPELGEDLHIPLFTDVYHGIKNSYSKFIEPFRFDETKFPPKTNQLTATFSRDKEYL